MENIVTKTGLEIAQEKYDEAIRNANVALSKRPIDQEAYDAAIVKLQEAEADYARLKEFAVYDAFIGKENAIIELIKLYSFEIIGHSVMRNKDDNNRITIVERVTKEKRINLLAFCKRAKMDTDWQYTASGFNQLMCLRVATDLGANVKEIAKSYYLRDKVKQMEMGKTPTSTTQVCKLLQKIIDEMLPNEDENGKPIYKVNNHDVTYLDQCYGKRSSRNRLTISVSKDGFLLSVLTDIAYRLVTGGKYGVDGFKVIK